MLADEGAGAGADVDVEVVDRAVYREQVECAQRPDLVDAAGEAAAAEDERRLVAAPASPWAASPCPALGLQRYDLAHGRVVVPACPAVATLPRVRGLQGHRAERSLGSQDQTKLGGGDCRGRPLRRGLRGRGPSRPARPYAGLCEGRGGPSRFGGKLKRALARKLRKAGGIGGAWVKDLTAGRVVFARLDRRRLALASNMKLFTTGTAVTRLGPDETLDTTAWALGTVDEGGVLHGRLLIRGAGDPTMSGQRLAKLASRVKAKGVRRVTGGLRFDSSIFDRRSGVPSAGVTGGPYLGSLSGLSVNYGFNRNGDLLKDPAKTAARLFLQALRRRDVRVPGKPSRRRLPAGIPDSARLAMVSSPKVSELIAATNPALGQLHGGDARQAGRRQAAAAAARRQRDAGDSRLRPRPQRPASPARTAPGSASRTGPRRAPSDASWRRCGVRRIPSRGRSSPRSRSPVETAPSPTGCAAPPLRAAAAARRGR